MKAAQLRVEEVSGLTGRAILSGSIGSLALVGGNLGAEVAVFRPPEREATSVADLAAQAALTIMTFDLDPISVQIGPTGGVIQIREDHLFELVEQWELRGRWKRIGEGAYPIEVSLRLRGARGLRILALCKPEQIEGRRWIEPEPEPEGGDDV